jgi:WD40 repeat protein/serine/threonine protein kinase
MSKNLHCPQGHRWQQPDEEAATGSTLPRCPICNSAATSAVEPVGDATDRWRTIAPGQLSAQSESVSGSPGTGNQDSDATTPALLPAPADAKLTPTIVAGYEILDVLGRGAMGVVYKARQLSLHRFVALKMVLAGSHAGPEARARFLAEAGAIAALQHPNIVQIYEVGEQDALPFFSMEIVDGGGLDRKIRGAPLPAQEAALLLEKLARAMHYAHQHGVVHRDLKPANVLLTAEGEPKVTDFGVAKKLQDDPYATRARFATRPGTPIGTPSYMAPEQAAGQGKLVGPLSDVYSLGAILYELLIGRPPFLAETAIETLRLVATEEPLSPLHLQPRLPQDLVAICLKCLRKEPAKRYGSAGELAEDLRRFLENKPIQAVPVGPWKRLVKWARRRPAAAALVAVSTLAALVLLGVAVAYEINLSRALTSEKAARHEAVRRLVLLNIQTGMDLVDEGHGPEALPLLVEALRLAMIERNQDNTDPKQSGVLDERMQRIRLAMVLRSCPRLCHVWDVASGEPVTDAAFSPDGRRVVTASADGLARVWDVASGQPIGAPFRHQAWSYQASFSSDGKRVLTASADGTARVWDVKGQEVCRSPRHGGAVVAAAFCPDERRFCTASRDGTARICDAGTGQEVVPPLKHQGAVRDAAFSPDGRLVVTIAGQSARLWNAATGASAGPELRHDGPVLCAAFDKDGTRLVTGGQDKRARLWDVPEGRPHRSDLKHDQAVVFACFSPDGTCVATASEDGSALVWTADGKPISRHLYHRACVNHLSFSPNGQYLATGSSDNSVIVWDVANRGKAVTHVMPSNGDVLRVRFSPDGRRILVASESGIVQLWQPAHAFRKPTPTPSFMRPAPTPDNPFKVKSADARLEVISPDGSTLQVRNAKSGTSVGPVLRPGGSVICAIFDPAGSRLLVTTSNGEGKIWEAATGRLQTTVEHASPIVCGAFSSDGTLLATGSADNTSRIWDAATGTPRTPLMKHHGSVCRVVFSPDRRYLLTASEDGIARIWNAATGNRLSPPLDPEGWVRQLFAAPGDPAVWDLPLEERPIPELRVEAEWLSCSQIDQTVGLVPLSTRQVGDLEKQIVSQYPDLLPTAP